MVKSSSIILQVVAKLRSHIINQARYNYPTPNPYGVDSEMFEFADTMTDNGTVSFLVGKNVIGFDAIVDLIIKIGVEDIYDEDGWVDGVADHIMHHKADCDALWTFIGKNAARS